MALPIDVIWTTGAQVYAIVFDQSRKAWNPTDAEFQEVGEGTDCASTEDFAIALTESDCICGWYQGSANLTNAAGYTVMAWEQTGSAPDTCSDRFINAAQPDYDGTEEITNIDLNILLEMILSSLEDINVNGGLTKHQARMLTEVYQRKNNNRPAK